MLKGELVEREVAAYRLKLLALLSRYEAGERTTVEVEAMNYGDALICLLEKAPLEHRERVNYLIDRYEALRAACIS